MAALVVAMFGLGLGAWLGEWHLGADSVVYRAGALTFLRGQHLYPAEALSTLPSWVLLPFTYPPAAALLFVPLAGVPAGLTWGVVGAVSIVALAVTLHVSAPKLVDARWWALPGCVVLAMALEPVWKTLLLGQINLILMAMVLLDVLVLCARGSRWGGILVGVAAAVKLTPLIFIPHLLITGRRQDAARALGAFVVLEGLMFLLIPGDASQYWTRSASDPSRIGAVSWIFDQSLNGLVSRTSHLAPWSLKLALGIGALLAVPSIWLVVRLHRRGEALGALLVTAFYALLVSPVSWSHHWVWAVPLVALLVTRGRKVVALVVGAFFASCVVMIVPNGGNAEFRWGWGLSILGNSYVLVAALGILGLAAWELRQALVAGSSRGPVADR